MDPLSLPAVTMPVMASPTRGIERVIWILWLQGFDRAPQIVGACVRSWEAQNHGWKVVKLTADNLAEYVDGASLAAFRALELTPPKFANLIRLYLINHHGGVWADATSYCARPLDAWLHEAAASGFFAFRLWADRWLREYDRHGPFAFLHRRCDRIISNWFLAAHRNNQLASRFCEAYTEFFVSNRFPLQHTDAGTRRIRTIGWLLQRNPRLAQLWTHPAVVRAAGVYPYFIFHYVFAKLVHTDAVCRGVWHATPDIFARRSLAFHKAMTRPITPEQMRELEHGKVPIYKLNWKFDRRAVRPGCVLDYFVNGTPSGSGRTEAR